MPSRLLHRVRRRFMRLLFLSCAVPALLLFVSCRKKNVWRTDFSGALQEAQEHEKELFVLFSGEDWDGKTSVFRSEVLDTDAFHAFAKDRYVLLNIDLSEAEQARTIVAPDAGAQEQAEAARLQSGIDAKADVIRRYGISSYPTVCVLSKEGYVLSVVQYDEALNSPQVLLDVFDELSPGMADLSSAIRQVRESSGAAKVRAIDSLYDATPESGRRPLDALVREVPLLDPDNESGLVGKYEFIRTYDEAIGNLSEGRNEGVVDSFVALAEKGHLEPAQKFEAYYDAAYLLALLGDDDYDRMLALLQKAQEVDPGDVRMEDIENLKRMIAQMRDITAQDGGIMPGGTMKGD